MNETNLRSLRFRREREASWRHLEALLLQVERRSANSLSDDDMVAFPALYRAALSSLSVARETSLDQALIDYLEALCARAYFFVYGARMTLLGRIEQFFKRDWPAAVLDLWRETLASGLLILAGAIVAYALVTTEPGWYSSFVPEDLAGGRDTSASTESLRETLYTDVDASSALGVFATFLFTHNAQIALFAFALGFAFCVPSALLLAYQGCMLGAMIALFASHGLGYEFTGWIFIHGVTELFAVTLAGAAGLRIGWSIAFPGVLTRVAAAERAGRQGAIVMLGVVVMLFFAGLLEGVARQVITSDVIRWSVAIGTGTAWALYFYSPRGHEAV
ncbi:MAG: stage II sporulation protein M [Alphaproteobacteria bacterium]|nr:stage II sporulation protein M [Alphaproteobacteria bacterium]